MFLGDGGGFEANIGRAAVRFIQPGPKESCLTAHTSHAFLHAPTIIFSLPSTASSAAKVSTTDGELIKKLCLRRRISSSLSKDILPMIMINYHHGDDDVDKRKFVKTNRREQKFPEFSFFIKQAMMMMTLTRLKVAGINPNEQNPK